MYQKNYVLLLVSIIICTGLLWSSRVYLVQGEETARQKSLAEECVDMQGYQTTSCQRCISYEVMEPEYVIEVSGQDIEILMRIVEAEAGGEDRKGKLLVANVVINRVRDKHFPDTVTGVVYQQNSSVSQFSPVANGTSDNSPSMYFSIASSIFAEILCPYPSITLIPLSQYGLWLADTIIPQSNPSVRTT